MGNSFDDLNDAIFAQIERVANAKDPDEIKREVERSKAVSGLAFNVISNMSNGIRLMQMQERAGVELSSIVGSAPKMLVSESVKEVPVVKTVPWEVADPWLKGNAESHTLSFLADRLNRPREEVARRCDELGLSYVVLNAKGVDWRDANAAKRAEAGL